MPGAEGIDPEIEAFLRSQFAEGQANVDRAKAAAMLGEVERHIDDEEQARRMDWVDAIQGELSTIPAKITERPKVGVGCIVIREIDDLPHVLMGVRKGAHGAGELALPGGKPNGDESPEQAAVRELEEETGINAEGALPVGFWSYDRFEKEGFHYVTLYFIMEDDGVQEAVLTEPDKCEGWGWYSPYAAPGDDGYIDPERPLFAGVAAVLNAVI